MLSWYYSILEELDDYQEGTGSTLSADVEFLIETATAVRHAFTGARPSRDDLAIGHAWNKYDAIVDQSIGITTPLYRNPRLRPYVRPAHTISRWMSNAMKYGMQLTGFDERTTRRMMDRHHLHQTRQSKPE